MSKKAKEKSKKKKSNSDNNLNLRQEITVNVEKVTSGKTQKKKRKKLTPKQIKRNKIIAGIVKWTILIILLLGSIAYIAMSPLFSIHQINVLNNKKISEEEIISLSGISLGDNTYKINKYTTIQKIKENAYIESVTITRKLPDVINIQIQERQPAFMLAFVNAYVYIDKNGYILEVEQEKLELPIIESYHTPIEQIQVGNRLLQQDLNILPDLVEIMNAAEICNLQALITKIDITDDQNYTLILEEEKKTVYLGDLTDINVKLLYLKEIIHKEQGKSGEVFLNRDLKKNPVYFREEI